MAKGCGLKERTLEIGLGCVCMRWRWKRGGVGMYKSLQDNYGTFFVSGLID